jgi:hypothetical protein
LTVFRFFSTKVELAFRKVEELKVQSRNPSAATEVNRRKSVVRSLKCMFELLR